MDIDRNGVAWVALGSGHLASFDRRKCKGPLNGPTATGQHCPEGWTLYPTPGPNFKNVKDSGSADSHYYDWVDQFDTLGLGKNTPIITGNSSDSLIALVNGKFVVMRVPYPLGFFAKGMDGRIDDPKAGWKGKGVWTTWGTRTPFHSETGKGNHAQRWSTSRFGPIRSPTDLVGRRFRLPLSTIRWQPRCRPGLCPCTNRISLTFKLLASEDSLVARRPKSYVGFVVRQFPSGAWSMQAAAQGPHGRNKRD